MKGILRMLGWAGLIFGVVAIILYSSSNLTGAVILESFGNEVVSIIGITFIIAGLALLSFTESEVYEARESKLRHLVGESRYEHLSEKDKLAYNKVYRRHLEKDEKRSLYELSKKKSLDNLDVIRTAHFERAIRNHNPELIQRAIDKIGTGKGKEEKLSNGTGYSVRVSKGDRIIFDKEKNGKIILKDYIIHDEYSRRA